MADDTEVHVVPMLGSPDCPHCWLTACLQAFRRAHPGGSETLIDRGLIQVLAEQMAARIAALHGSRELVEVVVVESLRIHFQTACDDLAAGSQRKH